MSEQARNEWILACNTSEYDIYGALTNLKRIDWKKPNSMKQAKDGDFVYIYLSTPQKRVAFKGAILVANKTSNYIDDKEYSHGEAIAPNTVVMEIAVFREYSFENGLTYADLKENGINTTLRTPEKLNSVTMNYLHKLDKKQLFADRMAGELPDTCCYPFPISYDENLDEIVTEKKGDTLKDMETKTNIELNTILFGPPGTGKTYNTVNYAVAIIEGKNIEDVRSENYDDVKARYTGYMDQNRIRFTTFHQSYGYEEFIEGIRPVLEEDTDNQDESKSDSELKYRKQDGIFKMLCDEARSSNVLEVSNVKLGISAYSNIWKISLKGAGDNNVKKACFDNDVIRIGWDQYGGYPGADCEYLEGGKKEISAFIDKMKKGDIVLSLYSRHEIDAIGVVTGDYYFDATEDAYNNRYLDDEKYYYRRTRPVKWIAKNIRENVLEINKGKELTLSTVYKLSNISLEDVMTLISKYSNDNHKSVGNYVMIIDEINRGNISKIFGELITLIEPSKREGEKEEIPVILPYSQKKFSVPKNVYILGTMNTADRSIALMDTALRRRFSFVEMMPNTNVLSGLGINTLKVDGKVLDIVKMLDTINARIEYLYDREHTIGHAFFTELKNNMSVEALKVIFMKKIIPLLQEYFYEDYQKLQWVLGDNDKVDANKFILDKKVDAKLFKGKNGPEIESDERIYLIQDSAFDDIESYIKIYE